MRYVRKEQKIAPKDKLAGFKQRTTVLPATAPVAAADPASAYAAEAASSAISEASETEAKALIGAPRVGGTIECGCGGRACIGGGAQRCCLLRCAYAESVKAHEKESHGRNDSDKSVMEVRT